MEPGFPQKESIYCWAKVRMADHCNLTPDHIKIGNPYSLPTCLLSKSDTSHWE